MSTIKEKLMAAQAILADTVIPTMPREIIEINRLFAQHEIPELGDISDIISQNASLAGEVIRLSNSPAFLGSRQSEVQSIKDAISIIGIKRIKNLITSLCYKAQTHNTGLAEVNEYSFHVATLAAELAGSTASVSEDQAYMAGLFHNAGAMLMAARFKDYDSTFIEMIARPYSGLKTELERYHTTHTIAGLLVAHQWSLNSLFSQAILMHHQVELSKIENEQLRALVAIIQLSSSIVTQAFFAEYAGEEVALMLRNSAEELLIDEAVVEGMRGILHSDN